MSKREPWWQDDYVISERTLAKVSTVVERLAAEHKHSAGVATDIMPLSSDMWLKLVVGGPDMAWEVLIELDGRRPETGNEKK